jgi:hypothetical protein
MEIVRHGIEAELLDPPEEESNQLGFPPLERREMSTDWHWAMAVYETAKRLAVAERLPFNQANDAFWIEVFGRHNRDGGNGRAKVRAFIRIWNREANSGRVPPLQFPPLPSRKSKEYRLREEVWPARYQPGLRAIRSWLEDSFVKGRGRKQKNRQVSVEQQIGNLLRFGGFFANVEGEDLSLLSWDSLFTTDRVLRFIFFTDPEAAKKRNGHRYSSGLTQESHLNTFIVLLRGPLQLPERGDEIENLKKQFLFERKRPSIREDLTPNDFYRCARLMVEKAGLEDVAGHFIAASILRRDALFIALNTLFPRRVDIWDRLVLGKHVIVPEGGLPRLNLWKEESKPEKADQILEIPPELAGLVRQYLNVDRPRLLGDRTDTGKFFVGQGGEALKKGSPRAIFRARVREFLRLNMGSHALRKIWTPRYLDFSHGDYLTVMAILDTSMRNIVNAYRDGQDRLAAKDFVDTTERLWADIQNGGGKHDPAE